MTSFFRQTRWRVQAAVLEGVDRDAAGAASSAGTLACVKRRPRTPATASLPNVPGAVGEVVARTARSRRRSTGVEGAVALCSSRAASARPCSGCRSGRPSGRRRRSPRRAASWSRSRRRAPSFFETPSRPCGRGYSRRAPASMTGPSRSVRDVARRHDVELAVAVDVERARPPASRSRVCGRPARTIAKPPFPSPKSETRPAPWDAQTTSRWPSPSMSPTATPP